MNKGKKAQKVVAKQEAFNPKNYEKNLNDKIINKYK